MLVSIRFAAAAWLVLTPTIARAAPLSWNLPADVRVVELRRTSAKPDIRFHYTLSIEPRGDEGGYRTRLRGLPIVQIGAEPVPAEDVEALMPTLPPALLIDRDGVLEGLADPVNARKAYAQLLSRTWERRGQDFRDLANNEAFIDAAMQRTFLFWVHWVTPILGAPEPPTTVTTQHSDSDDLPAWETVIRFLGPSPAGGGMQRYEATTTVDGKALDLLANALIAERGLSHDDAQQIVSRVDRIVSDVEPGSSRPIRVEATSTSQLRRNGRLELQEESSTYVLTWIERVAESAVPDMGECESTRILLTRDLLARIGEDAGGDMESCGTGLPLAFGTGTMALQGEVPDGDLDVRLQLNNPARTYLGRFEAGSSETKLTESGGDTFSLRRERGDRMVWARLEGRSVKDAARFMVQHGGLDFAGEELLEDERVTMQFDAIPHLAFAEILAEIGGMRTVTNGTRGRFVSAQGAREQEQSEPGPAPEDQQ